MGSSSRNFEPDARCTFIRILENFLLDRLFEPFTNGFAIKARRNDPRSSVIPEEPIVKWRDVSHTGTAQDGD